MAHVKRTVGCSDSHNTLMGMQLELRGSVFHSRGNHIDDGSLGQGADVGNQEQSENGQTLNLNRTSDGEPVLREIGLAEILAVSSVSRLGPQVFKIMHHARITPRELLANPDLLPMRGKRADSLKELISMKSGDITEYEIRAERFVQAAERHGGVILTYEHPCYPSSLLDSNYPVPVLFARGNLALLDETKVIACVGSREIGPPYADRQAEFVRCAVDNSFSVASGFALGADSISHEVSAAAVGKTICVMPGGLDRPFPPENRRLWDELLQYENAVFVSEAPFGARASSLTLRKRNKLIVSLSRGVMIGQSTDKGGAMNAFRFAAEQHKPIATFEHDRTDRTSGNLTISQATRVPTIAFRADGSDSEEWREWLLGL